MGWDDYMHMPVHAFLAIGNILAKQLKDEADSRNWRKIRDAKLFAELKQLF